MKNLYISNPHLLRTQSATVASESICSKIQIKIALLMIGMLMVHINGFGQSSSTPVTFQSAVEIGDWGTVGTWVYKNATGSGTTAASRIPSSIDNVIIQRGHTVTVSNTAACSILTVESASNNGGNSGFGTLIIESDKTLSITSFSTVASSNNSHPKARVTINTGGELTVSGQDGLSLLTTALYTFAANSTITYNSSSGQTITNLNYQNLHLSGSGIKTPPATLIILKDLTNNSTLNAGTSTINIGSSFTNLGTFNKGTGTINYNGGNQNAAGVAYHNLLFSGTGTKTATGGLSVGSNLDIISSVTFDAANGTHTIAGNLTNAGRIDAGTSTINIGGTFNSTGQFNKGTGNVIYNGNAQSISPLSYYNLTLTRASGTSDAIKTAGGAISVSNVFTINTGASFAHNNSAFFYDGDAIQNITPAVYYNLTLGGKDTKFATTGITVTNNFQVYSQASFESTGNYTHTITGNVQNDGIINNANSNVANQLNVGGNFTNNGTFNAKAATHTIGGNWLNDRTFNSDASTIILNGLSKTITSTITSTGAFNNLTVSNGTSSITTDITVNNALRVENTILQTNANTLLLGPTANLLSEETIAAHIKGTLQTTRNLTNAANGEVFGNIGIRITDFPSDINSVTVKRVTGTAFQSNLTQNSSVLRQFYLTTPTATTASIFNATIDMRFPAHELNEPAGTTYYDIYRENIDKSIEHLTKAATSDPYYNYKLSKADRKYGMYTISSNVSPLPVELNWFKAQRQANGVLLTWETASEKENKGFEVQVSSNGKSFAKVAFVDSKVVNSSVAQRYAYTDNATVTFGTRYYRLAQIDVDGTTTYSNIKAVNMDARVEAAVAYPNPFAEGQEVRVRLPQDGESRSVRIVLTNTLGQVILEQQAQVQNGQVELVVNTASAHAKGIYLLNVVDNGTKFTFKLIKK